VIVVLALIALVAAGCSRTPEQRAECYVKHISKELKLDDVQKAKLEKIKDEFLAKRPEMIKTREETVKEANALMRSAEIDKARLDALVAKSQAHANDMVAFIASKFTEIHEMLTPEQREKLVAHIEKYMKHRQEKGEPIKSAPMGSGY
jgi:Spy/CpxP family protein refolding chaperone